MITIYWCVYFVLNTTLPKNFAIKCFSSLIIHIRVNIFYLRMLSFCNFKKYIHVIESMFIIQQITWVCRAKEKYRGVFEIQKSGDKTFGIHIQILPDKYPRGQIVHQQWHMGSGKKQKRSTEG